MHLIYLPTVIYILPLTSAFLVQKKKKTEMTVGSACDYHSFLLWAVYPIVNSGNINQIPWTWAFYIANIYNLLYDVDLFTIPDILLLMPSYLLPSLFIYFPGICLQIGVVFLLRAGNLLGFSSTKCIHCSRNLVQFCPLKDSFKVAFFQKLKFWSWSMLNFVFLFCSALIFVKIVYLLVLVIPQLLLFILPYLRLTGVLDFT